MIHHLRVALAFMARAQSERRAATVWAYLKISVIDRFGLPRRKVKVEGFTLRFPSSRALRQLYEEIFLGGHYHLDRITTGRPVIVDGGANIGVSVIYFKLHYPHARIVCFEPSPVSVSFLRENVSRNGLTGVEIHEVALGRCPGEGSLVGSGLSASIEPPSARNVTSEVRDQDERVEVVPLSQYMAQFERVDVLKLDIEGSEQAVIEDLGNQLSKIEQVTMEYHQWDDSPPLSDLLTMLDRVGHRYEIRHWITWQDVATCMVASRLGQMPGRASA